MKIIAPILAVQVFLCGCDKAEEPVNPVAPFRVLEPNVELASSDRDGFFTLSLDGPIENKGYGVRLLAVGPNFATVLSTDDKTSDTAYIGEYFDGGGFGRIGLRLVKTNPETKSALMKRNILH